MTRSSEGGGHTLMETASHPRTAARAVETVSGLPAAATLRLLALAALAAFSVCRAETAQLFILWGLHGRWDGELQLRNGRLLSARPYSFEEQHGDRFEVGDDTRATWKSGVGGVVDGVQFTADLGPDTVIHLKTLLFERVIPWPKYPRGEAATVQLANGCDFVVLGRGDPRRGPPWPSARALPQPFVAPVPPADAVALPHDWQRRSKQVVVSLSGPPTGELAVRRSSRGDGRLYLELYSKVGVLGGRASVSYPGQDRVGVGLDRALWLSLTPRIDTIVLRVTCPGAEAPAAVLAVPTTLVEVRGPRLFLNGEPFLVKGTLPRDLVDADAAFLKALGANTLRGRRCVPYAERYGFMCIAAAHGGPGRFCERSFSPTEEEFQDKLRTYLDRVRQRVGPALASPNTLILQVGNEQIMGGDPWGLRTGAVRPAERLDELLARLYNLAKPLAPMLPVGYSNCAFGYIAPGFLDVYLHNTYLEHDRGWPPIEEFMALQGCDRRPYIHTEFGANVYMPQAHLRGPNSPVLEKVHAWNYPHRWRTYLTAGTIGGTNYCLYDYDYSKVDRNAWDKGYTNFGIMTFDRKPKLACWELWHLWRDFEVEPAAGGNGSLLIRYRRDYWARGCRLTLRAGSEQRTHTLEDFAPNSRRTVKVGPVGARFHWQMDYSTHAGLPMMAVGAHPRSVEAGDFLARLSTRDTYGFLRELFDAEVVTVDGDTAPPTLKEMEREDGVVPVAFRKPNGVVYVTLFTRRKPSDGLYTRGVAVDTAFDGDVVPVDEMTGRPTAEAVKTETRADGLRLAGIDVPFMPASYGQRSDKPITLPVFRITPAAPGATGGGR